MPKKPAPQKPFRKPAPSYPASPIRKGIKGVKEVAENAGQQVRNIANTVGGGVRKIKRSVGR